MKRFVFAAMILFAAASFAQAAGGTIVGGAHDFSGWTSSGGQICLPCHTPHHARSPEVSRRLWNHELSTTDYTTKWGTKSQDDALDGGSRLCMSCHDGTVSLDSFGGARTNSPNAISNGRKVLGTVLTDDHPVGKFAIYDDTIGGGTRYKTISSVTAAGLRLATVTAADGTSKRAVGCNTCHDAHRNTSMLLRTSDGGNDGSKLCLTCHYK